MTVSIAAADWDHAPWQGSFYPADLPPEWRLGYYANEFGAVVLPPQRWQQATAAEVAQWLEDTGPRFRFYIDASGGQAVPAPLLLALGERCGGVLADGGIVHERSAAAADARTLRAQLERLAAGGGDAVLVVEGNPPPLELMRTARTLAELLGL